MANKAPAFQWYPKDILSSTRVSMMTLTEEAAYRRAIDHCWLNGWLPADNRQLALVIGKNCSTKTAQVVKKMFTEKDGKLYHERLDQERDKQKEHREKNKKAANTRWKKARERNASANADALQTESQNHALHTATPSSSPIASNTFSKEKDITPLVFPPGEKPPPQKKVQPKKIFLKKAVNKQKTDHLFNDSPYYDFEKFEQALSNDKNYGVCDLRYYFERMKNWAASKQVKRKDWLAQARNFMLGDAKEGKLKLKLGVNLEGNGTATGPNWAN